MYSAAIFDLRRQNHLTYDVSGLPRQVGDFSTRGIELEAMTSFSPRSNFIAAYSYTPRAKVIADANPALIGTQPTATPVDRASMWMDYRFNSGLKLGAGWRYEGGTYGVNSATPVKVSTYSLIDAMAGFDFVRWRIVLHILNLTNKSYIANCTGTACYYGSPRQVLATAAYKW